MNVKTGRSDVWNLCLFTVFFQISVALNSYMTVFLQNNGFTPSQIGTVNALGYVTSFICTFSSGILSDKMRSVKKILVPIIIACAVLYAVVPVIPAPGSMVALMTVYLAICVGLNNTIFSLSDNILVRCCAERHYNFGLLRASGSFSFTVCGIICAAIVPKLGVNATFWLYALALVPTLLFLFSTREPTYIEKGRHKLNLKPLLSNKRYWVFIIFMFVYYLASRSFYGMLTVYMGEMGINTDAYGMVFGLRAVFEIPALILMVSLRKRIPLPYLVVICLIMTAITSALMGIGIHSLPALIVVQCITGIGNGFELGAATNYINEIAPDELKTTATSILTMASSLAGLFGNLTGGHLVELFGATRLYSILSVWFLLAVSAYLIVSKAMGIKFERSKI